MLMRLERYAFRVTLLTFDRFRSLPTTANTQFNDSVKTDGILVRDQRCSLDMKMRQLDRLPAAATELLLRSTEAATVSEATSVVEAAAEAALAAAEAAAKAALAATEAAVEAAALAEAAAEATAALALALARLTVAHASHVHGSRLLLLLVEVQVERDRLVVVQRLEAVLVDGGEVHEDFLAGAVGDDEAEALVGPELDLAGGGHLGACLFVLSLNGENCNFYLRRIWSRREYFSVN